MIGWLPRFGLHAAAALGATGIFVAAAAVGAHQTHPTPAPTAIVAPRSTPRSASQATPTATGTQGAAPRATPAVRPERSLVGTIEAVAPNGILVRGVGGRQWRVAPAPGALLRLNGKAAKLDSFQVGDTVVILGQAQGPPGNAFLAHAISAKSH